MTKVQVRFDLERALDDRLMERVAAAHGIYGMARVAPAGGGLVVDYDASRLTIREVEAALRRAGIPVLATTKTAP